jgi:hypothetical protein
VLVRKGYRKTPPHGRFPCACSMRVPKRPLPREASRPRHAIFVPVSSRSAEEVTTGQIILVTILATQLNVMSAGAWTAAEADDVAVGILDVEVLRAPRDNRKRFEDYRTVTNALLVERFDRLTVGVHALGRRPPTTSSRVTLAPSPMSRRSAAGRPPVRDSTRSWDPMAHC